NDFNDALTGLVKLPAGSRFGVYVAYIYYRTLFKKIKNIPSKDILNERIRVPNYQKFGLLFSSYFKFRLNLL
ncbi:MAG TPA: phytoene/squalene synthase family protein, partial [Bacteroidia bacterium]|nr:phytoene/squalene synthase family protein [Bacteroidia bacterium]